MFIIVAFKGWIKANRFMKKYIFIDVNDGTKYDNLQVILKRDNKSNQSDFVYGSSMVLSGKLAITPKGQLELQSEEVKLIGMTS